MTIKRILLPVGAIALLGGLVAGISSADASHLKRLGQKPLTTIPVGTPVICNVEPCMGTLQGGVIGDAPQSFTTQGPGTVIVKSVSTDGPTSVQLTTKTWTGTGHSDQLGDVTWEFDVDRPVEGSNITANQEDSDFPATAELYFHIIGSLSALPGEKYRSVTPVHLYATTINSFNPFGHETFALKEPVTFENLSDPNDRFTLTAINLTFNGTE
jgi:hypothetical protein